MHQIISILKRRIQEVVISMDHKRVYTIKPVLTVCLFSNLDHYLWFILVYNTNMQYPNTYYGNNLYGYGPGGFNNRFPNWNQGNYAQYYTGGTGSGLSNTLNYWYRSLRPSASSGPIMNNQMGPMMMAPPGRR